MVDKIDLVVDRIDDIVDRIEDLRESHGKRLDAIDNNLDIHMKRSDELEKSNELMENHFNERLEKLEGPKKAMSFLKEHLWKFILGCGTLLGIIMTALRILDNIGAK
jgi:hypothetical protein